MSDFAQRLYCLNFVRHVCIIAFSFVQINFLVFLSVFFPFFTLWSFTLQLFSVISCVLECRQVLFRKNMYIFPLIYISWLYPWSPTSIAYILMYIRLIKTRKSPKPTIYKKVFFINNTLFDHS